MSEYEKPIHQAMNRRSFLYGAAALLATAARSRSGASLTTRRSQTPPRSSAPHSMAEKSSEMFTGAARASV